MTKSYRRFSTEFKLRLVESYLAGDGSIKGLATQAGIDHSLLHYWINKYRAGGLTVRRGCRRIVLPRSTYYRRPAEEPASVHLEKSEADQALVDAITAIRRAHPAYGYRRVTAALRREGEYMKRSPSNDSCASPLPRCPHAAPRLTVSSPV
jgi:transposase